MKTVIADPTMMIDVTPIEEWNCSLPKRGDHIRVQRSGVYSHHGVYVSDNEVIHFTGTDDDSILDWSKCEVICTTLEQFLQGGSVEVKVYTDEELDDLYPVEHIVKYARACLGDKGYHLVFNNCEHFANVCTLGRFYSAQVERILNGKPPLEDDYMGIWGKIGGWLGGLFGGSGGGGNRSTSNTSYEPDKVKVAEIERDAKLQLATMENERVELMKQARLDILEFETKSNLALEQARAQGFNAMAQTILSIQEKLNEVAEKRLLIIEKGSLQVIKEIENFYSELGAKIQDDDDKYNTEKLPELLSILAQYDEGTPAHKLYMKRIEDDMALQAKHRIQQLDAIVARQSQVIQGFLVSKEKIIGQTGQITADMLNIVQHQAAALNGMAATDGNKPKMLAGKEKLALSEGGGNSSDSRN